jgi:hypothetical protein
MCFRRPLHPPRYLSEWRTLSTIAQTMTSVNKRNNQMATTRPTAHSKPQSLRPQEKQRQHSDRSTCRTSSVQVQVLYSTVPVSTSLVPPVLLVRVQTVWFCHLNLCTFMLVILTNDVHVFSGRRVRVSLLRRQAKFTIKTVESNLFI